MRSITLASMIVFALGAASAQADGVIDVNQDCATAGCFNGDTPGFPISITQPGHYRLSSDLVPPPNTVAVSVNVPTGHITLDLSGHTIRGDNHCGQDIPVQACVHHTGNSGVFITAAGGTIRNGTIRGFRSRGLNIVAEAGFLVDDMTFSENGASGVALDMSGGAESLLVRNSRFIRNGGAGFREGGTGGAHIEDSLFFANQNEGARIVNGTIQRSSFVRNGAEGALGLVTGCRAMYSHFILNNNGGAATNCITAWSLGL